MKLPFEQRAQEMGLNIDLANKGLYSYEDQYSQIIYRQLYTSMNNLHNEENHQTDNTSIPLIAIFTRLTSNEDYIYAGHVSNFYQFIGNNVLCQRVKDSINSVGLPILEEKILNSINNVRMRNEIIIQSSQQHPEVGDVLPVIIINNSYNGTCAANISFGIAMEYKNNKTIFSFSLGELRQVHIQNSPTEMRSTITSYMEVFTENISSMITQSFNSIVTENDMFTLLDVIEKYGRKRRESISALLEELQPAESGLPSSWQVFLAIVRYSSFEKNLNIKRLLENAAERVLVIPTRMNEVLNQL